MKKGIKILLKDFFWVFAWLALSILILTLKFLKIEISNIYVKAVVLDILVCFFFFLSYKLTVAKVLFPKNCRIKCLLLLKLFALRIMIYFFDFIFLIYFHELRYTNENSINELSLIYIIGAVFFAPFAEELVFRYHIYTSMKIRYQCKLIPAIISSFLFAYLHKFNTGYGTTALIDIFFGSLIYTYAFDKTGSILSSIILHASNNAFAILLQLSSHHEYGAWLFIILVVISFMVLLVSLIVFVVRKIIGRREPVLNTTAKLPEYQPFAETPPQLESDSLQSDSKTRNDASVLTPNY